VVTGGGFWVWFDMTALLQKPVGNRQFHHSGTLSRRLLCDCALGHIQTVGGDTRGCVHDLMLMACRRDKDVQTLQCQKLEPR